MPETTFVQTNIRLPDFLLRELKKRAAEERKSLAEIFRELGRKYLEDELMMAGKRRKTDPLWQLGRRAVRTGQKNLAQEIDKFIYGA